MKKGLHGEVKRDTHGKGTYTERNLHEKGRGYIQRERGNNTEWGEEIYTKTERRPHGEGMRHIRRGYIRKYAYNSSVNKLLYLFSDELLWSIIYLDQLYPI